MKVQTSANPKKPKLKTLEQLRKEIRDSERITAKDLAVTITRPMKDRCQHDVDHEGLYIVYTVCGRELSKLSHEKGSYPWKKTDRWCKHCLKARERART